MSTVHLRLSFSAIVSYDGRHWSARPLLTSSFLGIGNNPSAAVDDLERALQRRFERIELDSADRSALLWLSYQPPALNTLRMPLVIGYGKRTMEATLFTATFVLGERRYIFIPRLDQWFSIDTAVPQWPVELQTQLDIHLRALRAADNEWEPPPEALLRKDRILPARLSLRGDLRPFRIGVPSGDSILRALLGNTGEPRSAGAELRALAEDLTERHSLRRVLAPHPAVDAIFEAMTGDAPPIALVGPRGSGRTTLVHEAIARMRAEEEAEGKKHLFEAIARKGAPREVKPIRRVYHIDPQRIVTGMSVVGQWQRRLELVLGWVRDRRSKTEHQSGSDVVFIDDPVTLARIGRSRGSDMVASRIFHTWLESHPFPMILEATPEQWHRLIELDRPFADLFRVIRVDPPDASSMFAIANWHRAKLEAEHRVLLLPSAIERALELHARYGGARGLPGGVIDRLETVAQTSSGGSAGAKEVDAAFQASSGLLEDITDPTKPLDDAALRESLSKRLVGQPAAIDALVTAVHALKSGLRPDHRPVCCWLFAGPTGVGKTEAAKLLTRALFASDEHLVRFDMNAFADPGAVHRLIGTIGYSPEDGLLTTAIRRRPFAVLLLDEIEKAHPSVHDLLLQLLDEGRLTDATGSTTSFASCVVVMTSNVGATEVSQSVGFDRSAKNLEQSYKGAVARAFRPEFVNRIDRIVAFSNLGQRELRIVADLHLQRLLARDGFRNRTVLLDVPDETLDQLAIEGWDPRFGARGLKRIMERRLVASAASELATISPEQPVRITVTSGPEGTLVPRVETLHWARPLPHIESAAPREPIERIARIEQQIEPLRPRGLIALEESGLDSDPTEVLSLVETLQQMRDALDEDEDELPEGTSRAVQRISHVRGHEERHHEPSRGRVVKAPRRLAAGLRALLLDLAVRQVAPDSPEQRIDLAELRAASLLKRRPSRVLLRMRAASRETPEVALIKAFVLEGYTAVYRALLGIQDAQLQSIGQDTYIGVGAGLFDLLEAESGLHWWLPPSGAPAVIEVHVDPLAHDATSHPPFVRQDTILRVICPAASKHSHGAIHDLRTDETVRTPGDKPFSAFSSYTRWLLAVRRSLGSVS